MNTTRFVNWSERQQVAAVIAMAGLVLFLLWVFLLSPLNARRRGQERRIDEMRARLAMKNYLLGEDVLRETKREEEANGRALHEEWQATAARLSTFTNESTSANSSVGHIDFKVALFDVRQRLLKKSRALNISLPHDLGIDADVRGDEDARKLMLRLRTVEKLVDLTLDLKITMLKSIVPKPPVLHRMPGSNEPFLEEYPVEIEFFGTLQNLYDLFPAITDADHVFALRQIRAEAASPGRHDALNVNAVLSALVFLKDPSELAPPETTAPPTVTTPQGH